MLAPISWVLFLPVTLTHVAGHVKLWSAASVVSFAENATRGAAQRGNYMMNSTATPWIGAGLLMAALVALLLLPDARSEPVPRGRTEVVFWHKWGGSERHVVQDREPNEAAQARAGRGRRHTRRAL